MRLKGRGAMGCAALFMAAEFICISPNPVRGDVVFYRNQRYVKGRVTGQTRHGINLRLKSGRVINIPKRKIRKIVYIDSEKQKELDREAERRKAKRKRALMEERRRARELRRRKSEPAALRGAARNRLRKNRLKANTREVLMRSALLPGRGQYRSGRKTAAYVYGGLAVALAIGLYESNRLLLNAHRDLGELNNPYGETGLVSAALGAPVLPSVPGLGDPATAYLHGLRASAQRDAVNAHAGRRRNFALLLLSLYAWNLFDVLYVAAEEIAAGPRIVFRFKIGHL